MTLERMEIRHETALKLRRYNVIMGCLHALQALAVLMLANSFALPVTATYLGGPPGTTPSAISTVFESRLAWGIVAFLAISAIAHFIIASKWGFTRYLDDLSQHRNIARWIEYSVSSTLMIVLIAQLCGISDMAALLAIAGVNASMIFFGWLQERYERPGSGNWLPFVFGCIAGGIPWIAIVLYVWAPGSTSNVSPPGFVYGIIVSLFLFFNIFALNQWLQYKRIGRWRNYLYGESMYIALSLVAKSALAWQVFSGALAGSS